MRWISAALFSVLASVLAVALPGNVSGQAAAPVPFSEIRQVTQLSNAQAANRIPLVVKATVTYVRASDNSLFLTDGSAGVFAIYGKEAGLVPGDRVEVRGVTGASFRPVIAASEVRFLEHGTLPKPETATFTDLIQAKLDCHYIEVRGKVLSSDVDVTEHAPKVRIRVQIPDGVVEASLIYTKEMPIERLVGADVRLQGVAAGYFDSKMQMAGVSLQMNSWSDVEVVHPALSDAWSIATTPISEAVSSYRYSTESKRVRITGTLTYYEPGTMAVVENRGDAMLLETYTGLPLHTGQGVEVIGYPEIVAGTVRLINAQLRAYSEAKPVEPTLVDWESASQGKHANNLVSMEGQVMAMVRDARVDMFVILSHGHLFSASLRHAAMDASSTDGAPLPAIGSHVRVTGVCIVEAGNHWKDLLWFDLHMRSLADVTVQAQPSWWTTRRLAYAVTLLSALILAAVMYVGFLDRRLREQTATSARRSQEEAMRERQMTRQEQQRSHILELISSSQPLPEVLRAIQTMVSTRLFGAACWFELNVQDSGIVLERPAGPAIVYEELFSPEGSSLGFLLATPHLQTAGGPDIVNALKTGARLAELAIDTRRLYSDLRHRSEYDLLTDVPNRFSMERKLKQLFEGARVGDTIFGLIYVDFDRFKQVNDRYGHRAGDLYLQEGTRRMKAQLRNGDMLARIGGDEFVALVPVLRSRADAEDIAMRLERCFDAPFEIDGIRLLGSASVGLAVFPEDGLNQEELQRSADAAMYAHKEGKRHQDKLDEAMQRLLSKE